MNKNDKLVIEFISKLCLDKILLSIRIFTIILWLSTLWQKRKIELPIQMIFLSIIFISDALDGMISRRFSSPIEQYRFRILDVVVDKIGILAFLLTLLWLNYISYMTVGVIAVYHIVLLSFSIKLILRNKMRNIAWIQATMYSRFYAMSVGLYCFIAICKNGSNYENIWILYFEAIGTIALFSHMVKIKKVKEC